MGVVRVAVNYFAVLAFGVLAAIITSLAIAMPFTVRLVLLASGANKSLEFLLTSACPAEWSAVKVAFMVRALGHRSTHLSLECPAW